MTPKIPANQSIVYVEVTGNYMRADKMEKHTVPHSAIFDAISITCNGLHIILIIFYFQRRKRSCSIRSRTASLEEVECYEMRAPPTGITVKSSSCHEKTCRKSVTI